MANISNINNFFVVNTAQKRAAIGADLANNNGTPYVGVDFTVVGANSSSPVANLWLSNFTHKSYVLISDNSSNFIIRDPSASSNRLTIASGGNATFAAKVFSTSTVSGDIGTTLVTKDYVDSGDGSSINTILITVAAVGGGNRYFLDGVQQANAVLQPGFTYRFDQSNGSNSSHPLRFSSDSANSSPYTTGVTAVGTPGSSGAYTQIITTQATPVTLYYYCTNHAGMGGAATIRIIKTDGNATFANNVGIGTAAPDNILTLQAAAGSMHQRFKEASTTIGFIGGSNGIISGYNGKLAIRAEAGLVLSSQGNSADVVISSGKVGIGLTPVTGWGASSEVIQLGDGVSDYGALAWNTISGADHFDLMYQSYFDGTNYKYGTNSAAVTAIRQRNGEIFLSTKSGGTANATFTWDDSLKIDNSGNTTITTTSNQGGLTVTSATDNTVVGINNTATGGQAWRLQSTGGSSGLGVGKLFLKVGGTEAASNLISFITDGSGANIKMGIGTTSPAHKLQVSGDSTVNGGGKFGWVYWPGTDNNMYNYIQTSITSGQPYAAEPLEISGSRWTGGNTRSVIFTHQTGGEIMTIMTGGNVGIGNTNPGYKLDAIINTSATNTVADVIRVSHTTSGTAASGLGAGILFNAQRPSSNINLSRAAIYGVSGANADDDGVLAFYTRTDTGATGFSEKMRITSDGNVGIGTISPTSKLVVNDVTDGDKIRLEKSGTLVGSLGTYNGVPYIGYQGGAGGGIMFNGTSIEPTALGSSRTNNTNDIGSSSYRWRNAYLGGGIYLGGTASQHNLNYYASGTWTPTVTTSQLTSPTITSSSGRWQRVGKVVTASFEFTMSNPTVGAGSVIINNLPIAFADNNHVSGCGVIGDLGKTINVRYYTGTNQIAMNFYDGNYCGTAFRTVGTVTYWAAT